MTITLFSRTDFRGDAFVVTGDIADLKEVSLGRRPSSMRMTAASDAVLLFKNDDWHGGVMYRRGVHSIDDLGSKKSGGQVTFGNSVAAVRTTPFFLHLNITVVTQASGLLPGGFGELGELSAHLQSTLDQLNEWYVREHALLEVGIAQLHARPDDDRFNMSPRESGRFPAEWKNRTQVDWIVSNAFDDGVQIGEGSFPWTGQTVVTSLRRDGPTGSLIGAGALAMDLAHELGHFLGSWHHSAQGDSSNIMTQGLELISGRVAAPEQIEEWHTKLSRDLSRRGNRRE